MSRRAYYVDQCAAVIEERARLLQKELDGPVGQSQSDRLQASDRAAILEARHLARIVRTLADPIKVRGAHPHDIATGRLGFTKNLEK